VSCGGIEAGSVGIFWIDRGLKKPMDNIGFKILAISDEDLTLYSSWASIFSLLISIISLLYVRSIRANIVKFRRKQ